MRGVTRSRRCRGRSHEISTHTPRAGSDCGNRLRPVRGKEFQPTLPVRGVTKTRPIGTWPWRFQPTLPVRGVTPRVVVEVIDGRISTHTPRAGSDPGWHRLPSRRRRISTHTPRAGSDLVFRKLDLACFLFQPTLPVRGVTCVMEAATTLVIEFQPTLPVRGVTQATPVDPLPIIFQPTLPVRGVTAAQRREGRAEKISTHTPRAGSDGVYRL